MFARTTLLLILVCLTAPIASGQASEPLWLTVDDASLHALQGLDPGTHALFSIDDPAQAATPPATTARLHVVAATAATRDWLARHTHLKGGHRSGFVAHASLAEALAQLKPVDTGFTPTRPDYTVRGDACIAHAIGKVSDQRIGADIQTLSAFWNRYYNSTYGRDAADWLFNHWLAIAGARDDVRLKRIHRGTDLMPSVVLEILGDRRPSQVLVLGAHLDSINWSASTPSHARAPGADDDASGIASITEVLRVIVEHDLQPARSIHFMAYSGEEKGLLGSNYIATDYRDREVNVVGVLQLDMTNYKGSSGDIYLVSDQTDAEQNQFLEDLAEHYLPELQIGRTSCGYACSDHASWNARGYAASFPFEAMLIQSNPHIHGIHDTWETMGSQATHAQKFARLATAWLVELAGEFPSWFCDGFEAKPDLTP